MSTTNNNTAVNHNTPIIIRENVPIPAHARRGNLCPRQAGPVRAAVLALEPGQSFFLPYSRPVYASASGIIQSCKRKTGRTFTTRIIGQNGSREFGVWRVS